VSSLAPTDEEVKSKMTASKAEHEKKVELLTEQTNHEKKTRKNGTFIAGGKRNVRDICLLCVKK
jgi:hypothetical protein